MPCGESIQDNLTSQKLNKRKNAYDTVNVNFGFLFDFTKLPLSDVREQSIKLQKKYSEDFGSSFTNECIHVRGHLSGLQENDKPSTVLDLYKIVKDLNISSLYPYVEIALRTYLCCAVKNCSAERSFSALKIIKSYLRSTMDDYRLNSLAILSVESEITSYFQYKEVIEEFALQKAHRKI